MKKNLPKKYATVHKTTQHKTKKNQDYFKFMEKLQNNIKLQKTFMKVFNAKKLTLKYIHINIVVIIPMCKEKYRQCNN